MDVFIPFFFFFFNMVDGKIEPQKVKRVAPGPAVKITVMLAAKSGASPMIVIFSFSLKHDATSPL